MGPLCRWGTLSDGRDGRRRCLANWLGADHPARPRSSRIAIYHWLRHSWLVRRRLRWLVSGLLIGWRRLEDAFVSLLADGVIRRFVSVQQLEDGPNQSRDEDKQQPGH